MYGSIHFILTTVHAIRFWYMSPSGSFFPTCSLVEALFSYVQLMIWYSLISFLGVLRLKNINIEWNEYDGI